jgi:hypothetical protein
LNTIFDNCILYNKPDTIYAKTAIKLRTYARALIEDVTETMKGLGIQGEEGTWKKTNVYGDLVSCLS